MNRGLYSICPFLENDAYFLFLQGIEMGCLTKRPFDSMKDHWNNEHVEYPTGNIRIDSTSDVENNFIQKVMKFFKIIYGIDVHKEVGVGVSVYYPGEGLPSHWDGARKDLKTPTGFLSRDYSTIFYPRSKFTGGLLHFINLDLKVEPKDNMLLLFPSSELYTHRVENVITGTRHMCSNFWCEKK